MEKNFVRLFERCVRRKARQFGHLPQECHRRHLSDERIVLRHVADARTVHVAAAVEAENARAAAARLEKSEEGEDEGGLTGAVGAKEPHGLSAARRAKTAGDPMKD